MINRNHSYAYEPSIGLALPTLPMAMKLKREAHRKVAEAQDLIVVSTFDTFGDAVIHGGTAIWRCYGGNRFSEDVVFSHLGRRGSLKCCRMISTGRDWPRRR